MRRLGVFLDGTWNTSEDNTNVWRLYSMCGSRGRPGEEQRTYYDAGVGTEGGTKLRGGAFGKGLSRNIRQAYQWLVENYEQRDAEGNGGQIFLFGFSRGAYTARSLAGMIARCGLLKPGSPVSLGQVWSRYHEEAEPLYSLLYRKRRGIGAPLTRAETLQCQYARRVRIRFTGVWDTVGALGVPWPLLRRFTSGGIRFHNTRLSRMYEHAYQALALDENRKAYDAALWTRFTPTKQDGEAVVPRGRQASRVEQRWFVGAHSNVGGGYTDDLLPQRPLAWIQDRAMAAGMVFRATVELQGREHLDPPVDSYAKFLWGIPRILPWVHRYFRRVARTAVTRTVKKTGVVGRVDTVGESLDWGIIDRWKQDAGYRPKGLIELLHRRGLHLDDIEGTQDAGYPL